MQEKILIVAEEVLLGTGLLAELESAGYPVTTALTTAEGYDIFVQEEPRLVIIDINLLAPDDPEIIAKLKLQQHILVDVLVIADGDSAEQAEKLLDLDVFDILLKPVRGDELLLRCRQAVQMQTTKFALKGNKDWLHQMSKLSMLGNLAMGIAHEIFQPLQTISNNNTLIKYRYEEMGIDDEEIKDGVHAIKQALERQKEIILAMHNFARPEDTSPNAGPKVIDINQAIKNSLKLFRMQSGSKNIHLQVALLDDLPGVKGSLTQIEQISVNMLVNAMDAIQMGDKPLQQPTITVRTYITAGMVYANWENTGPQIPDRIIGSIFDPFFTTKKVGKGTGLGLSICHGIAKNHGGELTVKSNDERTVFILGLPAGGSNE